MADSSKLYITITDERGTGGTGKSTPVNSKGISQSATAKEQISNSSMLGRYIEHEFFHTAKNMVFQNVNYALSNIGNFTGDYITQRKVNQMKQAVSEVMTLGMMTVHGATVGGVAGAVVGFAIGSIGIISSEIYSDISRKVDNAKANYNISQLRERAGLNQTNDNSRGTEN